MIRLMLLAVTLGLLACSGGYGQSSASDASTDTWFRGVDPCIEPGLALAYCDGGIKVEQ